MCLVALGEIGGHLRRSEAGEPSIGRKGLNPTGGGQPPRRV